MYPSSSKLPLVTISAQAEDTDNIGNGRKPAQPNLHAHISLESIPKHNARLS